MGNKVIFSSKAGKEVHDSFYWYENRVTGLGEQFIYFIDLTIELILQNRSQLKKILTGRQL